MQLGFADGNGKADGRGLGGRLYVVVVSMAFLMCIVPSIAVMQSKHASNRGCAGVAMSKSART